MASFTDNVQTQFAPYTPTIPVEAYTKVGMYKQQQYNKNLQKLQQQYQGIKGLPVDGVYQGYLEDKLKNLKNNIQHNVGGDLSNQSIANYVEQQTRNITSDPILQSAVSSTQRIQKAREDADKARTTSGGKYYNPVNEWNLNNSIKRWRAITANNLAEGKATPTFSGGYIPYSNYNEHIMDALSKAGIHPDQHPYTTNEKGQIVLSKALIEKTGLSRERLKAIVDSALTEADKQQLAMEGRYNYRGANAQQMSEYLNNTLGSNIAKQENYLRKLNNVDKKTKVNNPGYQNRIDSTIDSVKRSLDFNKNLLSNLKEEIKNGNVEDVKSRLFISQYRNNILDGYAFEGTTYKRNPYLQEQRDEREFQLKIKKYQDSLEEDQGGSSSSSGNGKNDPGKTGLLPGGIGGEAGESMSDSEVINAFKTQKSAIKEQLARVKTAIRSVNPYLSDEDIADKIASYGDTASIDDPLLGPLIQQAAELKQQNTLANKVFEKGDAKVEKEIGDERSALLSEVPTITVSGYTYTPQELLSFAVERAEYVKEEGAAIRLKKNKKVARQIYEASNPFSTDEKKMALYNYKEHNQNEPLRKLLVKLQRGGYKIEQSRKKVLSKYLRGNSSVFQTQYFSLDDTNSKKQSAIRSKLNSKVTAMSDADYKDMEKSLNGRNYDKDKVPLMLTGDDAGNTKFNYIINSNTGEYYVELTNSDVADEPSFILLSEADLKSQFPNFVPKSYSREENLRNWIRAGETNSTNWTLSPNEETNSMEADPLKAKFKKNYFPLLQGQGRFSVTADIRKTPGMDYYYLYYHIKDNDADNPKWVTRPAQISKNFQNLGDFFKLMRGTSIKQIKNILGINEEVPQ